MNSEQYEKIKRHFNHGGFLELENADGSIDTFKIKQLPIEKEPELLRLANELGTNGTPKLSQESLESAIHLGLMTTDTEDFSELSDREKQTFVEDNLYPIIMAMFGINDMGAKKIKR
jgi:hypothetical protein